MTLPDSLPAQGRTLRQKVQSAKSFGSAFGWAYLLAGKDEVSLSQDEFTRLLLAIDTLEAHEWCAANDACAQRIGLHESEERGEDGDFGWIVLDVGGDLEGGAATLPEAVSKLKALKAKLSSPASEREGGKP